jgi:ABC-2 type transport system ATP-binding protein
LPASRPDAASATGGAARRAPGPLVLRGIGKRYGSTTALADVHLLVAPGEIVGLVGPNGSGKTTALLSIAGLVPLGTGQVEVAGHPAGTLEARRAIAFVPDEPGGLDELTVAEHVRLVLTLHRAGERSHRRAYALAETLGLDARWNTRLGALSRGLRRQAAIVAALALETPLVLVDEATATLDPEAVVVLREALTGRAAAGAGVLLATQDLHFAEHVCDTVSVLQAGRVVVAGAPAVLRRVHGDVSFEDAFLAETGSSRLRERVRRELAAC